MGTSLVTLREETSALRFFERLGLGIWRGLLSDGDSTDLDSASATRLAAATWTLVDHRSESACVARLGAEDESEESAMMGRDGCPWWVAVSVNQYQW